MSKKSADSMQISWNHFRHLNFLRRKSPSVASRIKHVKQIERFGDGFDRRTSQRCELSAVCVVNHKPAENLKVELEDVRNSSALRAFTREVKPFPKILREGRSFQITLQCCLNAILDN